MSDAFAILSVTGTLVEALQIKEQYFVNVHILSRFRIGRLITLNLLSHGRKECPLMGKNSFTLENRPLSVKAIYKGIIAWFLFRPG
jgi:hypothetical protein